ncbi:MAG: hypothetical protein Q8L27_00840 [archaeon]|nr:hypothetical protein [archaeon]
MIFKAEPYLYNQKDKDSSLKINAYNIRFNNGILICPQTLYYLIIGSYSKSIENISSIYQKLILNNEERIGFKAITQLLNTIRVYTKSNPALFITPHIFTKFISLLWDKNVDEKSYRNILKLFKEDFSYIQEEDIKKEVLIELDNFRNKVFGISEASLSILKNRRSHPSIISSSPKVLMEYNDDFLYVDFNELTRFIKEDERRNSII